MCISDSAAMSRLRFHPRKAVGPEAYIQLLDTISSWLEEKMGKGWSFFEPYNNEMAWLSCWQQVYSTVLYRYSRHEEQLRKTTADLLIDVRITMALIQLN